MSAKKLTAGVCRFCQCTDHNACPEGCSWADRSHTLCSACVGTPAHIIESLKAIAGLLKARPQVLRMVRQLQRDVRRRAEAS